MRTTVTLDEAKLEEAQTLTGIKNRSHLLDAALDALLAHEASMRLAKMGGSEPGATLPPRRRFS